MAQIIKVADRKQLKSFIDYPHELYKNDRGYVPELFSSQLKLLTKHPFHQHSTLQCFILVDKGKIAGRIAAVYNTVHIDRHQKSEGFFGFFDTTDNTEYAQLLFGAAEDWLKERNVISMIGPVSFSMNEVCGVLTEGFKYKPVIMMAYNFNYYPALFEACGFHKNMDLIAWRWEGAAFNDRPVKLLDRLLSRLQGRGITIRSIDLRNFDAEVARIRKAYNASFEENTGFLPLNDDEFSYIADDLKQIVDPDLCLVAEKNSQIIGFAVALPDVNPMLATLKKGRLFPFGIFKLLFNKNKYTGIRIFLLGVLKEHRKLGIEACMYAKFIQTYVRKGLKYAEAGWTLENNDPVNRAIININGSPEKRYRIYQREIR